MHVLTRNHLRTLAEHQGNPCVSLYLPTMPTGNEQKDVLQLKNLLGEAQSQLEESMSSGEATALLKPASELLEDHHLFWQHQSSGLAIFLLPNTHFIFQLPGEVEARCHCADHAFLAPLVPFAQHHQRFYILAMSQQNVRLIEANETGSHDVHVSETPGGVREALGLEEGEKSTQYHGDAGGAIIHGHGALPDHKKKQLVDYLHMVDERISELLKNEDAPLVFAGAAPLFGHFRNLCSYQHLMDNDIEGNPDHLSSQELQAKAWPIVEPLIRERTQAAIENYGNGISSGKTSDELSTVLSAAYEGRIDTLFVAEGTRQAGHFDIKSQQIIDDAQRDLVDEAVLQTLRHDGRIYVLPADTHPGQNPLSALFRY